MKKILPAALLALILVSSLSSCAASYGHPRKKGGRRGCGCPAWGNVEQPKNDACAATKNEVHHGMVVMP